MKPGVLQTTESTPDLFNPTQANGQTLISPTHSLCASHGIQKVKQV